MNAKRGFIVPLVIVIIAVLAIGGGYFAYNKSHTAVKSEVSTTATTTQVSNNQTTTTQTNASSSTGNTTSNTATNSNLKTYANAKYGFELTYPKNWITEGYAGSGLYAINFTPAKDSKEIISVQIFDNSKGLSLQDWVNDYLKKSPVGLALSNQKEVTINNIKGLRGLITGSSEAVSPTVFLSNDKKIYIVTQAKLTTKAEPEYDDIFEKMVSSIKLTKAVATTEADIIGCYAGSADGEAYMGFSKDDLYQTWNPANQPSPAENGTWTLDKTGGLTITSDSGTSLEKTQTFTSVVRQGDKLILNDPQFGQVTFYKKVCN